MPLINDRLNQNRHVLDSAVTSSYRSRFTFDPDAVVQLLKHKIAGQRDVIETLGAQLRVVKADLCEPAKPLYVTLFVGDTGVGKTEVVRLLASAIHGSPDSFCRIDMNTLSQGHYSAAITGAPPGYVGSKEGVTLFNEELLAGSYGRPGIVLFDEIEKASADVSRALMNILDAGKLKLASGSRELDFSNCMIFMTSNLGSRAWMALQRRTRGHWFRRLKHRLRPIQHTRQALIEEALHAHFDPEFLNRIDRIELFEPLSSDHLKTIIALELERTNRTLQRKGVEVTLDQSAMALLEARGFDPEFGARSIRRSFRELVVLPLATALLSTECDSTSSSATRRFHGSAGNTGIRFTAAPLSQQHPRLEEAGQEMKP